MRIFDQVGVDTVGGSGLSAATVRHLATNIVANLFSNNTTNGQGGAVRFLLRNEKSV